MNINNNNLQIKIISPVGNIYEGECDMAVIPTPDGEIGVMADHESLITSLTEGVIEIFDKSKKLIKKIDVKEGFLEIKEQNLLILSD
jgi:F-type H+-transporting ATPase subunit epsilon